MVCPLARALKHRSHLQRNATKVAAKKRRKGKIEGKNVYLKKDEKHRVEWRLALYAAPAAFMRLHQRQPARSEAAATVPLVPGLAWAMAGVDEATGVDGIRAREPAVAQVLELDLELGLDLVLVLVQLQVPM